MMDPAKLGRVIEAMDKRNLAGLLIYSRGTTFVLRPSYLHYFSGVRPVGKNTAAVVSRDGKAVLLVEPAWDACRLRSNTWITDVRGTSRFLEDLPALLEALKITGTLGVMGSEEMGVELYGAVSRRARIEEAGDIVEDLAGEKTERELRVIRETGKIADVGFKAFLKNARAGIREYELLAEIECAMRSAGADDIFILLSSGSHNQAMHAPSDRRLAPGDIVIGEITPAREGQFIQLCRTVVLGEPPPVLKEKYAILLEGLKQSMTEIRSGNPASLLSKAMNRVIGDAGYAKYCYPPFMRARGHGFGVGSIAPGAVIDDNTPVDLKRHQVVIAHPNQYFPETGYLACGETVLVTDMGPERLSETETKLYWNEV